MYRVFSYKLLHSISIIITNFYEKVKNINNKMIFIDLNTMNIIINEFYGFLLLLYTYNSIFTLNQKVRKQNIYITNIYKKSTELYI